MTRPTMISYIATPASVIKIFLNLNIVDLNFSKVKTVLRVQNRCGNCVSFLIGPCGVFWIPRPSVYTMHELLPTDLHMMENIIMENKIPLDTVTLH